MFLIKVMFSEFDYVNKISSIYYIFPKMIYVILINKLNFFQADAEWKRIQQNTFTRWANEHLKTVDKAIDDLSKDLSDGLKLIALIEVLSGKKMPRHNKRPNFRYIRGLKVA